MQFGLTRTAIRQHLSRLVDSGLVLVQPVASTGPGRPCHRYRAAPLAAALWQAGDLFEQAACLLVGLGPAAAARSRVPVRARLPPSRRPRWQA